MNTLPTIAVYFISWLFLMLPVENLYAQVTAGSIPPGTSIIHDVVELSVTQMDHDTIAFVDIDGDGLDDVRIWLLKGFSNGDGINLLMFTSLNNAFSFCIDSGIFGIVSLFDYGEVLCGTGQHWSTDSVNTAACYGGWTCTWDTAVVSVSNRYMAYRKNATDEVGWLRVSMSLHSDQDDLKPVTFTISEMLGLYLTSGTQVVGNSDNFKVVPNPSIDGKFRIESDEVLTHVEIFRSDGRRVMVFPAGGKEFILPWEKGVYIIQGVNELGQHINTMIVRL